MVTLSDTQQSRQTRNGLADRLVAGLLVLIPIIVFGYVWARYAVNVPKWDDHALKEFLDNLDKETSVSGKLYQFFKQHNEHRIVYDRFVTWLDFNVSGKLNYRHLMFVGNLSLVGLLVIFGRVLGRSVSTRNRLQTISTFTDGLVYLPPVAFLLFNLSQWENMFWGMAALQNFTVILWVFWTIYRLAFARSIWSALLLATLATLTSGNGLLIWPIGIAVLLTQVILQTRTSWKPLISWTVGAITVITLYFLDYKKPPGNPPTRGSFVDLLKGWFAFNGAAGEAFPLRMNFTICLVLGGIVSILALVAGFFILRKGLINRRLSSFDYFFAAAAVFLLGTAATVAWSRVGFGMDVLITSRYKVYSLVLLALVYTYAVIQMRSSARKWVLRSGLLASVVLMLCSYRTYLDETIWWRQWRLTNQFNWTYTTNQLGRGIDPQTARWVDNAPAFYDPVLTDIYKPAGPPLRPFTSIQKNQDNLVLTDTASVTPTSPDAGTYLLIRSSKRLYLFQTTPRLTSSWKAAVGMQNLFRKGISGIISEAKVDPATYQIERLVVTPDGVIERYPTGQTITATPQVRRGIQKNW